MFHTGSSIFRGARLKYGDPLHLDDVAVDFPELKIVAFHMGYPHCDDLNMVALGHPNVHPCLSLLVPWAIYRETGTPPERTPELFERFLPYALALGVEQVAHGEGLLGEHELVDGGQRRVAIEARRGRREQHQQGQEQRRGHGEAGAGFTRTGRLNRCVQRQQVHSHTRLIPPVFETVSLQMDAQVGRVLDATNLVFRKSRDGGASSLEIYEQFDGGFGSLDDEGGLAWNSSHGTTHLQPARGLGQRMADFFYGLLPIEDQL